MKVIKFDDYCELEDKYAELSLPPINYGLTEEDLNTIESNQDKYLDFAIYLSQLPAYSDLKTEHTFKNFNAAPRKLVSDRLNKILKENIKITD